MIARWTTAILAAAAFAAGASPVVAACSMSVQITPSNGSSFGAAKVIGPAHTGGVATTFTIPTSGQVTQSPALGTAGAAWLLHPPSDHELTVTVTEDSSCSNPITVQLIGQSTGSPSVTFPTGAFAVLGQSGYSGNLNTTVSSGGMFSLTFSGVGNSKTAVFLVGTSFTLAGNAPGGTASWTTQVVATSSK